MQIGEVIRKYRREKNMTQEEMAGLLGVTAPAVNKWENGNSMPDILLLAPIARLLDITPDVLLSFREELSQEEIGRIIKEADTRLQNGTWEEGFLWAKKIMEEYPNCEELILNLAEILNAWRLMQNIPDTGEYEKFTEDCYKRALESKTPNGKENRPFCTVKRADCRKHIKFMKKFSFQVMGWPHKCFMGCLA